MLFEITYSLFFAILIFLFLVFFKRKNEDLSKWDLGLAFLLKCLASLLFIYVYGWHFGPGKLHFDSSMYISDGKILNNVFYKSPLDFLKFMTGIGDTENLTIFYLSKTIVWSLPYSIITNDSQNIVRLNSLIHFFSFNCIFVHFAIFNLFALNGIINIFNFFKKFVSINKRIFFYAIILIPSLLFFSSGVLKEPMLIFALGLFFRALTFKSGKAITKYLLIIFSILILLNFKAYVLVAMTVPLLFVMISTKLLPKKSLFIPLALIGLLISVSLISFPKKRQAIVDYISVKQFDFNNISRGGIYFMKENSPFEYNIHPNDYKNLIIEKDSFLIIKNTTAYRFHKSNKNDLRKIILIADPNKKYKVGSIWVVSNSYVEPNLIFSSNKRLIENIPSALINTLFRPIWNDPGSKLKIINFLETCLVFALLIFAFIKRKKLNRNEKILVITLVLFILILSLIIGWATPVLGAIVRYRIPIYLSIVILSFIIIKPIKEWKKNIS